MRYAIFSDVHANLIAWEAVRHDMGQREVDVLVCLGDVVGYGPRPMEVLEGVLAVTPNILMGNHDAAAVGAMDCSIFNERAQRSTEWTAMSLTEEARTLLANLPLALESEGLLFVHAEVCHPERFGYVNGPDEARENFLAGEHRIIFIGHTHYPKLFEWDGAGEALEYAAESRTLDPAKRYIVNVGSVGEPRDANDLRARYVIYDTDREMVEFHAVEFNIPAYRADLEMTNLGLEPFFLQVFEQSAVDTQKSLFEEAPSGRMLLPEGKVAITERLQLNPQVVHTAVQRRSATARPSLAIVMRSKGNGVAKSLVIFSLLLVTVGISWWVIIHQRGLHKTAGLEEKKAPLVVVVDKPTEPEPISLEPVVDTASPKVVAAKPIETVQNPKVEPSSPVVVPIKSEVGKKAGSGSGLRISVAAVGDKVPTLDNSHGTLELAYNFGYGGNPISQDGITFQSVTHALVAGPVYGTTHGITVKGSSGEASTKFNVADLGDDLWQTITYTEHQENLRLEVTGLMPKKSYQIQVLLGEPRKSKNTRYDNGLITVTDSSGASQSTRLTFGNGSGVYALLRIEVAASESLLFDMPKAGLGPGVAGIVIHSTPSSGH